MVVGEHLGGYLPFTLDVTDALRDGENELRVVVRDPSDTGHLSRGKQRLARGGIWYTPQSGIWQTVWMEAVPARWIQRLEIVPDLGPEPGTPGAEMLQVIAHVAPDGADPDDVDPPTVEVVVRADGIEVARTTGQRGRAPRAGPARRPSLVAGGPVPVRPRGPLRHRRGAQLRRDAFVRARARCRRAPSPAAQR